MFHPSVCIVLSQARAWPRARCRDPVVFEGTVDCSLRGLAEALTDQSVPLLGIVGAIAVALALIGRVELFGVPIDLGIASLGLAALIAGVGGAIAFFTAFDLRWFPNPANPWGVGVAAALLGPVLGPIWALSEGGGLGMAISRVCSCQLIGLVIFLTANRVVNALEELDAGRIAGSGFLVRSSYDRCVVAIWTLPPLYLASGVMVLTLLGGTGWPGFVGRILLLGFVLHAAERACVGIGLPWWRRRSPPDRDEERYLCSTPRPSHSPRATARGWPLMP